jgi:hypothetical protein
MLIPLFLLQFLALRNDKIYLPTTEDEYDRELSSFGNQLRININLIVFPIILLLGLSRENHYYVMLAAGLK